MSDKFEKDFKAGLRMVEGMKRKTRGFDASASEAKQAVQWDPQSLVEGTGYNSLTGPRTQPRAKRQRYVTGEPIVESIDDERGRFNYDHDHAACEQHVKEHGLYCTGALCDDTPATHSTEKAFGRPIGQCDNCFRRSTERKQVIADPDSFPHHYARALKSQIAFDQKNHAMWTNVQANPKIANDMGSNVVASLPVKIADTKAKLDAHMAKHGITESAVMIEEQEEPLNEEHRCVEDSKCWKKHKVELKALHHELSQSKHPNAHKLVGALKGDLDSIIAQPTVHAKIKEDAKAILKKG